MEFLKTQLLILSRSQVYMATEARQVMCRQPAGGGDDSLQSSGLVQTRPECRISIAWFSSFVAKAGNLHMCWTLPVFKC